MTEVCDFLFGGPGPEAVAGCKDIMLQATQELLTDDVDEHSLFDYGPSSGAPEVRRQLADFLTIQYNDKVESDNLFITVGASHGIHLVSTVLIGEEVPIFVEDPTYFLAIGMFKKDFGYRIIPVPTEDDGIDVTALEKLLQETPAPTQTKSPFRRMLYTMTVHHNPKGSCLSPEKCWRLISLARQYDMLLFAEDVYNLLTYTNDGVPPLRLFSYDNKDDQDYKGHTLSNSTFSKIFSPGLRVGWIESAPRIIKMLSNCYTTTSGYCFNHYMSCVVGKALELGLIQSNLTRLRKLYGERIRTMCRRLRENQLPVSFVEPLGGFFVWLKLPENVDAEDLCAKAKAVNLLVQVGSKASPTGGCKNFIRLSVSVCSVENIENGIDRLSEIIRSCVT
ncbi:uncharacterized protein LOC134240259 [Saccostrea cucullata]|uniref:uncharacterized protein LOC134240259 n=1 Tax=Saccostrea cuccullata TaxID=36930 RepID=UPI002ED1C537